MEKRLGVHRRAASFFRKLTLASEAWCFSASASKAIKHLIKDDPTAAISQIGTKKYSKFLLHVYSLSCIIITIQFKAIYEEGSFRPIFPRNSHFLEMNRIV